MSDLAGKVALVTGAAQGLGYAVAKAYIEQEMRVALIDVKAESLRMVANEFGANAYPLTADLSNADSTRHAISSALDELGAPRILVHNAAILVNRPLLDVTLEAWQREVNVGIQAAFLLTQAVWQAMTDAGGGSIVYVSSRSGIEGFMDESPYCTAKHGLEGFMKCMAMEGASRNIAVNTITPGMYMHTPMSEYNYTDELKRKWVDPYLLTPAFITLANQDAAGITGQRLNAWELSGHSSQPN
jgi:NAD(P)-dependent dehydrogenase (short-subunit alcohol dehydrogenase family)